MALTYVCYAKHAVFSANPGQGSLEKPATWMTFLIFAGTIATLVLCFTLFMCKRIILGNIEFFMSIITNFSY